MVPTVLVTIVVIYIISNPILGSIYTQQTAHRRNKLLLIDAAGSNGNLMLSPIGQLLATELNTVPGSGLIQKHILPLTNANKLSSADLPVLLQATNFTDLTTAQLLDTAVSSSSHEKWQLMNLHQQLYCR